MEEPELKDNTLNNIKVSLVGLKNLKSTHTYRLEFDVFEQDNSKIKELVDKMDNSFYLYLVPMDEHEKSTESTK